MTTADLKRRWHSFLTKRQTVSELADEFASTNVARSAIDDLLSSWPVTWSSVVARCRPNPVRRSWLFILPNNHSLVGVYPLFCAYFCRLQVAVRRPQTRFAFLNSFLEFVGNLPQATIRLADRSTKIDALLVYGHDLTIDKLRKSTDKPIVAFGTHDTVAVVTLNQLQRYPDLVVRDAFSLGQRGCLSVKMLFVVDASPTDEHFTSLQQAFKEFWQDKLPLSQRLAIDQERFRYRDNHHAKVTSGYPLFACLTDKNFTYEKIMPRHHFVLPVVVGSWSWLKSVLPKEKTIKTMITNNYQLSGLQVAKLGCANRPCWDGSHEGRGLFACT